MRNTTAQTAFRQALSIVCILLLLSAGAFLVAQEAPPGQSPPEQAGLPMQAMFPEQLVNLLAPVALSPDSLLSQFLVAATYPLEIVEAAQWLQQNRNPSGAQLVEVARQQNWDTSIQALVGFPDVLTRLNSDIRRSTDLGNAFLSRQADVMNAALPLRAHRGSGRFERHGTATEVEKARSIIASARPISVTLHSTEAVGAVAR